MQIIFTPTIQISNGKIQFHIPTNTILDLIIPDIWGNIFYYYQSIEPLTIGNFDGEYYGYRLVTNEECKINEFIKLFNSYSFLKENIDNGSGLYTFISMDNINGSYLWVNNGPVIIKGKDFITMKEYTKKFDKVTFNEYYYHQGHRVNWDTRKVGLFTPINNKFNLITL